MKSNFVYPDYNGKNFINILNTIRKKFNLTYDTTLEDEVANDLIYSSKKVVFLLVDAFGYESYCKIIKESKFLQNANYSGKITSQFPSTTTVHVTSVVTGKPVYNHGFFEWFCYDHKIDEVFIPFLFDYSGKEEALPKDNLFNELKKINVNCRVFSPNYIQNSYYSKHLFKGANIHPFENINGMFKDIIKCLKEDNDNSFYYGYYCEYDSKCHEFGIGSKEANHSLKVFEEELDNFYNYLEQEKIDDTTIILTADHGQTIAEEKIYLNLLIPEIERYLITKKLPVGYNRDMFLYTLKENEEIVLNLLRDNLKDKAEIKLTKELIDEGVFKNPSETFLNRIGNIVILPYEKKAVWWYEEGSHSLKQIGTHGGLSKEEMEIPLVILKK